LKRLSNYVLTVIVLTSCAPYLVRTPVRNFFKADDFSLMGKLYLNSKEGAGCFSFTLSERAGESEFVPSGALGSSEMFFRGDEISRVVISVLKGRYPVFLKKLLEKEDEVVFFFSRNSYALKKMSVRTADGNLSEIRLFFKKGFAEIEVMDIAYVEN